MPVQFDTSTSTYSSAVPSKTLSVSVADNPNRVLYIAVLVGTNGSSVASVVRDGQSASLVYLGEFGTDVQVEIWRIIAPSVGTADATVTFDANSETVIGALSLHGVNQVAPESGFVDRKQGSFSTYQLVVAANSADDLVVDVLGVSHGGKVTSTPGAGQTQRVSNNDFTWRSFFISTKPGVAGNVTMEQTISTTIASGSVFVAFAVAPAGGGSPPLGTVTIGTITPSSDGASVAFSYDDTDQTGFEYRIDGGTAQDAGTSSPLVIGSLTPSTQYDIEIRAINADGAGAWSAVETFTTTAAPPTPVKGVRVQLGDGTPAANLTDLSVRWWDASAPTGAPDYESDTETTDASGWLEIDLSAVTALAVGASGYLHVFKAGATPADDIVAAGRVPISDIA